MGEGGLAAFARALPKAELHAHLNGCVRGATLEELAREAGGALAAAEVRAALAGGRDLRACFALFPLVHRFATRPAALARLVRESLADLAADGVVYAELRTTPKDRPEAGLSKRTYLEAVLRAMEEHNRSGRVGGAAGGGAHCEGRLIVSVDRKEGADQALATVQLAAELAAETPLVVGVDLSGDPAVGEWSTWEPALQLARAKGLPVTLHFAELPGRAAEGRSMLAFAPERLGHAVRVDPALERELLATRIPVEVCLTSNLKTQSVRALSEHVCERLLRASHPVALCTDDSGVFDTTLSAEFLLAADAFGLSRRALFEVSLCALEHAFLPEGELKESLREHFSEAAVRLGVAAPDGGARSAGRM